MNNKRYFSDLRSPHSSVRFRSLSWVLLLAPLTGCKTVTLVEIDRMSTALAPPKQVMIGGTSFSVESIFDSARQRVIVAEDETTIDPLATSTPCVTDQELDSLGAHRLPQTTLPEQTCLLDGTCGVYHVHVVVVDYVSCEDPGFRGVLSDTRNRGSVALFYPITKNDLPPLQLRTLAHELAHAFNLHHEEATSESMNVMTITPDLGSDMPLAAWALSPTEIEYLKEHPARCVLPGTGSFYSVYTDHPAHAPKVTQECTE